MKLEDAIKQVKPFQSPYHKLLVNILYSSNWIVEQQKKLLDSFGITNQQYNALRILKGCYPTPVTTSVIRERMLDKMSDTSRLIDRLCIKKLVVKTLTPEDKRRVDILITPAGIELLDNIRAEEEWNTIFDSITQEEAELMSDLLDKIRTIDE